MNFGQTALQVLKTVAPTLALAVGGPFGPLAAAALHAALGSTDQATAETALVNATPDQLLQLKKADQDFAVQMETLGIAKEKLSFDDTASARSREVAVKDMTPRIIAYVVIVLVLVAEGSMFFVGQPKSIDGVVLGRILGTLDSALMLVLGYYFGSSAGSSNKDSTILTLSQDSTAGSAAKTDAINKIVSTK
jgi:hypothetical protein